MTHPTHHFIAKRDYGTEYGWGFVGEGQSSLAEVVTALIESFDTDHVTIRPDLTTVRVWEIDGGVNLDRTEDALIAITERFADVDPREYPFAFLDLRDRYDLRAAA